MKPNGWKTLIAFVVVGAISAGLLWGMDRITDRLITSQQSEQAADTFSELFAAATRYEPIDTTNNEVDAAYRVFKDDSVMGYAVTVTVPGYGGDLQVHVGLNAGGTQFRGIRIGQHQESEGYGAKIAKSAFYGQFTGVAAPVAVGGYTGIDVTSGEAVSYQDGTYTARQATYTNEWRAFVTVTIEKGAITQVNWDADNETGDRTKKQLSQDGEYVMTETGPKWHEQAYIMEQALIQTQDPSALIVDANTGLTDAYTGVSIKVNEFVQLAAEALQQAIEASESEASAAIDGVSGATVSSKAAVKAANTAYRFVLELVG